MPVQKITRWQGVLETMGISSSHINVSAYSQARKRKLDDGDDAAPSHATQSGYTATSGLETCGITVPGLLAMMMAASTDSRLRRVGHGVEQTWWPLESVLGVAQSFIDVVLATKDVVFPTVPCVRVVNGYVDNDALQASQDALGTIPRCRTAFIWVMCPPCVFTMGRVGGRTICMGNTRRPAKTERWPKDGFQNSGQPPARKQVSTFRRVLAPGGSLAGLVGALRGVGELGRGVRMRG